MRTLHMLLATLYLVLFIGCSGARPLNLGLTEGKLAPCPTTPNCVSSQSTDTEHAIEPLTYRGDPKQAMAKLEGIIRRMPRSKVVAESGNYLYAEFTSLIFRFVDDVEFYLDEDINLIQVRSASRLGKSDFGVNRKRIEAIREAWTTK